MIAPGKFLAITALAILLASCFRPGGGGTGHVPPEGVSNNQATELRLTFHVWGAGVGRLDKRFTNVVCLYRTSQEQDLSQVSGTVIDADQETMEMLFVIPPLDLAPNDTLTYKFEMLFDGYQNIREGAPLTRLP